MEIVAQNNWDFTLWKNGEQYILEVVFHNSMIDLSRAFLLPMEMVDKSLEKLIALSEDIRTNYDRYKKLEIEPPMQ